MKAQAAGLLAEITPQTDVMVITKPSTTIGMHCGSNWHPGVKNQAITRRQDAATSSPWRQQQPFLTRSPVFSPGYSVGTS
ncbi:MAG: hypothetical protein PVH71_01205 [Chromatiales bacterium]|jgi:hypothetical protein